MVNYRSTYTRMCAYSDNNVWFTVISDGTIRLEYAPDGKFVNNKSFVAVNRTYEKVNYCVKIAQEL